jgi:hypothetical protein
LQQFGVRNTYQELIKEGTISEMNLVIFTPPNNSIKINSLSESKILLLQNLLIQSTEGNKKERKIYDFSVYVDLIMRNQEKIYLKFFFDSNSTIVSFSINNKIGVKDYWVIDDKHYLQQVMTIQ